ncbi:MAG TPA: CoA transferase [Candidatus Binataceae bacterium]|nr:CoA transferase [Candidatus Binataceae bacterium]
MSKDNGEYRESPKALDGIHVVELPCLDTIPFMAGAMAAKLFADFGAEVIKVEPPGAGAKERQLGPFRDGRPDPETSGLHLFLNTNKQSVTLDLESPRDRELLFPLLESADIVFNPNLPALNVRLGIGWRRLVERFPKLVAVSVTYFGAESAYRNFRGGDLVATHMSGVGWGTPWNQVTDLANEPPLKMGGRQSDYLCAYTAAASAMIALFHRDATGAGQHVDVSQWLSMVNMMRAAMGIYSHESPGNPIYDRVAKRIKRGSPWVYPCKDGWVTFAAGGDRFWNAWKLLMGNPAWMNQEIFSTPTLRTDNVEQIEAKIRDWLPALTRQEAFEKAQGHHIPCFPVYSPAEVAANPQYAARHFFVEHDHPVAGKVTMPGAPCKFSGTPSRVRRGAPRLGEHNRELLGEQSKRAGISARAQEPGHSSKKLPLSGVRIIDFGWIFAVPHATAWLGAMGADVVRIETSRAPDMIRRSTSADGQVLFNRSGVFNVVNFSRRSIALDLTKPQGREVARRLVKLGDVVSENFTVGNMRKYGLGYDDLRKIKPDIIMLSCTPLGQDGPYARTVGWGPTTQAFAGLCHLTGYPGGGPSGIAAAWPDFAVSVGIVYFILTALHHRNRTGQGQHLDVSMAEMVTSMIPEAMMDYFMTGRDEGPKGNRDDSMAPHGAFPVSGDDEWVAIAIAADDEFAALCEVLGAAPLAADPKFARVADRLRNVDLLEREVAARTRRFGREELVARLRERGLSAGPVYNIEGLLHDEVFANSGMLVKLNHRVAGERTIPVLPPRFSAIEPRYWGAPTTGEQTDQVLTELLGLGPDEIAKLHEEHVLV